MLNVFPELLALEVLGITILRLLIGFVLAYIGLITMGARRMDFVTELQVHDSMRNYNFHRTLPWILGLVELITGAFIVVGFLTQIMALISAYLFINMGLIEKFVGKVLNYPTIFNVVMIVISLTLVVFGAGAFAIDLPL